MYYVLSTPYPYPTPVGARGTHHCIGGTWASLDLSIGGASSPVCATPGPGPTAQFSRLLCAVGSGPYTRSEWWGRAALPCPLLSDFPEVLSVVRGQGGWALASLPHHSSQILCVTHQASRGQSELRDSCTWAQGCLVRQKGPCLRALGAYLLSVYHENAGGWRKRAGKRNRRKP